MNPFKRAGFDTLIGVNVVLRGNMELADESSTVIDGKVYAARVSANALMASKLIVNGSLLVLDGGELEIVVPSLIITGEIRCTSIRAESLYMKKGARLTAQNVHYQNLHIENGAVLNATLCCSNFNQAVEAENDKK